MTDNQYGQELHQVESVVRQVGMRIREIFSEKLDFQVQHKSRKDLVTEIDIWSENLIAERLKGNFPQYLMVGEETHQELVEDLGMSLEEIVSTRCCWVVDPLDGTTNFANGIAHVGVSVALVDRGKVQMGVVYDPARDELFSAIKGAGAFLNGKKISASKKTLLEDAVVGTGFPTDRAENWGNYKPAYETFVRCSRAIRRYGAATLDLCWVACGRFDGFFEYHLKPWDLAAGTLIASEAGALVSNFTLDRQADYSLFGLAVLAAGEHLHPLMLERAVEADCLVRRGECK